MAGDKLFYYQTLALYAIIDIFIIYLTVSVVTPSNRSAMYSLFIFLLTYSIFGLYLFTDELSNNYGLSQNTIQFTNTTCGNIQKLTSYGLMLINIIGICIYIYSMATDMSVASSSASAGTPGTGARTAMGGGARKKK